MEIGIRVKTKSIYELGFIGNAWKNYSDKEATTINACSNDSDIQMIRFDDLHEIYWPVEYLEVITQVSPFQNRSV